EVFQKVLGRSDHDSTESRTASWVSWNLLAPREGPSPRCKVHLAAHGECRIHLHRYKHRQQDQKLSVSRQSPSGQISVRDSFSHTPPPKCPRRSAGENRYR